MQTLRWPFIQESKLTPALLQVTEDTEQIGALMPKEESENFKLFLMELKQVFFFLEVSENMAFH